MLQDQHLSFAFFLGADERSEVPVNFPVSSAMKGKSQSEFRE